MSVAAIDVQQGAHIAFLRRSPPLDFTEVDGSMTSSISGAWQMIGDSLFVIASESLEEDGGLWLHVSISRPSRVLFKKTLGDDGHKGAGK